MNQPDVYHPVADIFPMMKGQAFEEFCADIAVNGLREAIWRYDGKIIDGRNRYQACLQVGTTPRYQEWDGKGDLLTFVVSLNLHRRHLSESQRGMIAAKISNRPPSVNNDVRAGVIKPASSLGATLEEAGELLNVHRSTVIMAKKVRKNGAPEVIAAVEAGEITLHAAKQIIEEPKEKQVVAMGRHKLLKGKRPRPSVIATQPQPSPEVESSMKGTIKVSIDTSDHQAAAAELIAALDTDFLKALVKEISGILSRRQAAHERGFGPARKD